MNRTDAKRLIERARQARKKSYSPYSNFPVGAALMTTGGKIYTGTNVENGVNGLSICAERVALFKAISEGETGFDKLAVVCGDSYCRPCGACRQTLSEHAPDLTVIMSSVSGRYEVKSLAELLPKTFGLDEA
ncbi:MAG: cytidine deaminase [Candidatus Acetothermia bacterium]